MSRIGKQAVIIPDKVDVKISDSVIEVSGPKGKLSEKLVPEVESVIEEKDGVKRIVVSVKNENDKLIRSKWGLQRSLINNMVIGVVSGYEKKLEINGVGYKAEAKHDKLILNVGFSHPVEYKLAQGISATVEKNLITITGIDKHLVGQTAAEIRSIKKPEPYKGKGIKYVDEIIRRKVGKVAKSG
jgi:large subunit ribosomal protein L6